MCGLILVMKHFTSLLLWALSAGAAATAGAAPLQIDYKQSKIDVAVSSTIDSFVGHLDNYKAVVDCDASARLPTKASVSFNFADLKTGNADRDAEMLKWLGYSTMPTASFVLTGWRQSGTTTLALGQLTIHGVKKDIAMPVTVKHFAGDWEATGSAALDYTDFNLPKIRKMVVLVVDPHLKVNFHIVGKLAAAK